LKKNLSKIKKPLFIFNKGVFYFIFCQPILSTYFLKEKQKKKEKSNSKV